MEIGTTSHKCKTKVYSIPHPRLSEGKHANKSLGFERQQQFTINWKKRKLNAMSGATIYFLMTAKWLFGVELHTYDIDDTINKSTTE